MSYQGLRTSTREPLCIWRTRTCHRYCRTSRIASHQHKNSSGIAHSTSFGFRPCHQHWFASGVDLQVATLRNFARNFLWQFFSERDLRLAASPFILLSPRKPRWKIYRTIWKLPSLPRLIGDWPRNCLKAGARYHNGFFDDTPPVRVRVSWHSIVLGRKLVPFCLRLLDESCL